MFLLLGVVHIHRLPVYDNLQVCLYAIPLLDSLDDFASMYLNGSKGFHQTKGI